MAKRPYDLPSLTALACFEAAARHQSFKSASEELSVTPAAVSHQIKLLEAELGRQLFRRYHRGVELSENGAYLLVALQRGFAEIGDVVAQLRVRPERTDVIVHASTAVSSLWLTPRLAAFWKQHPEITVSQHVSDDPAAASSCDLSIEYGQISQPTDQVRPLFNGQIVALGSPRFAAVHGIRTMTDLPSVPLIHVTSEDRDWTNWADWLACFGQEGGASKGFSVNNYVVALEAAQDDMGAVLGWTELVGEKMDSGKLVQLVPEGLRTPKDFYIRMHPHASRAARLLVDWLTRSKPLQKTPNDGADSSR